jgi:hypothetical protein
MLVSGLLLLGAGSARAQGQPDLACRLMLVDPSGSEVKDGAKFTLDKANFVRLTVRLIISETGKADTPTFKSGQSGISCDVTVKNDKIPGTGGSPARGFKGAISKGKELSPELAPVFVNCQNGTQTITATLKVDTRGTLAESDEGNNSAKEIKVKVTCVTPPPPPPPPKPSPKGGKPRRR